jgi:ABC-type multidrug transport system ATPase subunit
VRVLNDPPNWAFLTCRETVAFAADLYLDLPTAEKTQRVDAVLQTMGLSGCADTKGGVWQTLHPTSLERTLNPRLLN